MFPLFFFFCFSFSFLFLFFSFFFFFFSFFLFFFFFFIFFCFFLIFFYFFFFFFLFFFFFFLFFLFFSFFFFFFLFFFFFFARLSFESHFERQLASTDYIISAARCRSSTHSMPRYPVLFFPPVASSLLRGNFIPRGLSVYTFPCHKEGYRDTPHPPPSPPSPLEQKKNIPPVGKGKGPQTGPPS